MTIEPTNPVATPAVTVAALLADLALLEQSMEPEDDTPVYPAPAEYDTLCDLTEGHVALLSHRKPTTAGEALAMLALACGQLCVMQECRNEKNEPAQPELAIIARRLIDAAMPLIAAAMPDLTPAERTVVDAQAGHVLRWAGRKAA